jgi:dihydropyrimidinase
MRPLDLVVRGGTVVTQAGAAACDVGVRDGRVVALDERLPAGAREVDATGRLVLPGGVDSHVHLEQRSSMGVMTADDFHSGTVAAAFGGTTTVIPFCAQHREDRIPDVLADAHRRARAGAVVDYAFHLIVTNPDARTLAEDLPRAIADGVRSFKVFMTYERMRLDDEQILDVMAVARREGALVMVHAENHGMIAWLAGRLVRAGHGLPRYHGVAHTRGAEAEAIQRAIALAELADCPVLIVHVSTGEGVAAIREARGRGLRVYGETCPQYLFLTAEDLDRGLAGAMFCCSPPPRDAAAQAACWTGLRDGALAVYSSDHAPYRYDESGKLPRGPRTTFKEMANGVPGIELRLPLLFSEGVGRGRLSLPEFVALGAARHAEIYGLWPRKGTIAVGSDADLAVWDPERTMRVTAARLHDRTGYTPYEGMTLRGWPVTVLSRGEVVVADGELRAAAGRGRFLAREASAAIAPAGRRVPELARLDGWGTPLGA